uniref:DAN domain-containing protein n=1 Tax=Anopheles epiroticus TaxID=199890 RepID=A0A182PR29_9DIPT
MATVPNVGLALAATVILATLHGIPATANREHKVHNIVLYPNKQSWCTTRNISQVIAEPGCKQVTIDNNVCVGACFSYSIPHTEPSDPGEIIGPYCDSCQPAYLYKQVQLIHNCTCTACDEQATNRSAPQEQQQQGEQHAAHHPHQAALEQELLSSVRDRHLHTKHSSNGASAGDGSEESPSDSDMIQDDIPEILEVVHYSENDTEPIRHTPVHELQSPHSGTTYMEQQQANHYEHNSHTDNVKKLLHQKIVKLLRSVEETNSQSDRAQLIEMIRLIKGTSDRNWDELVESLQSENSILDFNRLRTELVEDEPLSEGDEPVAARDGNKYPEQHPQPDPDHRRLMEHQYDTLRHRAHEQSAEQGTSGEAAHHPHGHGHHHQHGHHKVGERIDAHHHLGRGPHGALVIQADRDMQEVHRSIQNGHEITEKIHLPAHELKPNHAGTVVTYDGHGSGPTAKRSALGDSTAEERDRHFQTPHMHPRAHAPGHHGHGQHDNHGHQHHEHGRTERPHHHQPHLVAAAAADSEQ